MTIGNELWCGVDTSLVIYYDNTNMPFVGQTWQEPRCVYDELESKTRKVLMLEFLQEFSETMSHKKLYMTECVVNFIAGRVV